MSLELFSPAKVNLFLRILGRRPDGYHELASLFQAINLGDILRFSPAKEDQFSCSGTSLPLDHSNLVIKALRLFRERVGWMKTFHIHLEKKIPIEAGLGGGSSNAATTLWGLNALHGFPLKEEELQKISIKIGSDIPFFFSCGTAYCRGRGEHVMDLSPLEMKKNFSLLKPKKGLSTASIFKELNLQECSKMDPSVILQGFSTDDPLFINDLELPSFRLRPELKKIKETLFAKGCEKVFMTGSGTALIGIGEKNLSDFHFIQRKPGCWYTQA